MASVPVEQHSSDERQRSLAERGRLSASLFKLMQVHEAFRNDNAVFVPFGLEVSGGLGDAATAFLDTAFSWVRQTQDPDVYHWSSSSFQRYWYARVGAAIIRQRARIGMAAAGRDRKHNERTSGLGSYAP